jgi:hypothetical protein
LNERLCQEEESLCELDETSVEHEETLCEQDLTSVEQEETLCEEGSTRGRNDKAPSRQGLRLSRNTSRHFPLASTLCKNNGRHSSSNRRSDNPTVTKTENCDQQHDQVRPTITLALPRSVLALISYAQDIVTRMTGNPSFPPVVAKNWFGNSRGPRVAVVKATDAWK